MRSNSGARKPEETYRAPPVWYRMHGSSCDKVTGFFPTSWLYGPDAHDVRLIRLDTADHDSFSAECFGFAAMPEDMLLLPPLWSHVGHGSVFGPAIESFVVSAKTLLGFLESFSVRERPIPYVDSVLPRMTDVRAFDLLCWLLEPAGPSPVVRCLQMPVQAMGASVAPVPGVEWLVLHESSLPDLERTLHVLQEIKRDADQVSVIVDDDAPEGYKALARRYRDCRFFTSVPRGAGVWHGMDCLSRHSQAEVLLLHDSRYFPCAGRRDRMIVDLLVRGLDVVGAHEIRIQENLRALHAVRFPDRVTRNSLIPYDQGGISLRMSAMRRSAALEAGGFAAAGAGAYSESEFLYRLAATGAQIGNTNDYLWTRRVSREDMEVEAEKARARFNASREWARQLELRQLGADARAGFAGGSWPDRAGPGVVELSLD